MKVDLYLKVVLGVIAVCLVWLCLGKVSFLPEAKAQGEREQSEVGRYQMFQGSYSWWAAEKEKRRDMESWGNPYANAQ